MMDRTANIENHALIVRKRISFILLYYNAEEVLLYVTTQIIFLRPVGRDFRSRVFFASCLLIIFPVDPGHFPDVLYIFHFFFLDPQRCLGVFLFCICCNTPFSCPSQISSCKI